MFIRSLRIEDTVHDSLIREVAFHEGANFIVDTEDSISHNKVGKTTFLRLIDVAMGAKNKKLIYTDADTGAITEELRDFIIQNKVAVELVLTQDLRHPESEGEVCLHVDLFPNGHYCVDGERLNQNMYWQKLNAILFDNEVNTPTLRQLINSFVRVSVGGDDNAFLKTLPNASNATYRSIYNFLFRISDPELDRKTDKLNRELSQACGAEKRYKKVNNVDTIGEQEQILSGLKNEYKNVKSLLDDIIDSDVYKANRDAINAARNKYSELSRRISDIEYRLQRNSDAMEGAVREHGRQADIGLSRRFYDEVCLMIPSINKSFESMVDFNNQLCDNKISYFKGIEDQLEANKRSVTQELSELVANNNQFMSLVEEGRVEEYDNLQARLSELSQKIGKCQEVIASLSNFAADQERIKSELESVGSDNVNVDGFKPMVDAFNAYFKPLASLFNNESPILVYLEEKDKFPVVIRDLSGSSTGTRKSLIAAFDFAYQQFAQAQAIKTPRFIVHDVLENIEGGVLRAIIEKSNVIQAQYIVAVLKEKLDSSEISKADQSKLQVLQLSKDNMLFTRAKQ